jgi:hypothetical protein
MASWTTIITMETRIGSDGVWYAVLVTRADGTVTGDTREAWSREVPFGPGERFHAGGAASEEAAREQARIAERLASEVV